MTTCGCIRPNRFLTGKDSLRRKAHVLQKHVPRGGVCCRDRRERLVIRSAVSGEAPPKNEGSARYLPIKSITYMLGSKALSGYFVQKIRFAS